MRLAARLSLAFGGLVVASTAGLGLALRYERQNDEAARFTHDVSRACDQVLTSVRREAERDRVLVQNACSSGELVDRVAVALARGDLAASRMRFAQLVPDAREAYGLDSLLLAVRDGDIVGAAPRELSALPADEVAAALAGDTQHFELRVEPPATVVRCLKGEGTRAVGLLGTRSLLPTAARLAAELDVSVRIGSVQAGRLPDTDEVSTAECSLADASGHSLAVTVGKSRAALTRSIARLDRAILSATLLAAGLALVLAVLLARSLGRPLAELAVEARRVKSGDAKPIRVVGSGEVRDLVLAFQAMLQDLTEARARLAAASRLSAWREVARRVAHEVKNPLAPIRAAIETLRRLRARQDPAFDEYFDEASRTVLDEVHRLSTIVTEFTRFARLPSPRPATMDLLELVNDVVALQRASTSNILIEVDCALAEVPIVADRDQIVQVLTNLVQNALDATRAANGSRIDVHVASTPDHVVVRVVDDGVGVSASMQERLFEPYATTKSKGTGLGLAISLRIAQEHGGSLSYVGPGHVLTHTSKTLRESRAGQGASFELRLPHTAVIEPMQSHDQPPFGDLS